jgi:SAM-dependent methyltransferase
MQSFAAMAQDKNMISSDVIVLPAGTNRWILMNVFSRSCVAVDTAGLMLLNGSDSKEESYSIYRIHRFSNADGLLADPTRLVRPSDAWPPAVQVDKKAFLAEMERYFVVIPDRAKYVERFAAKQSPLDRVHFGNFHQQLGQCLLAERRVSPESWWVRQKFSADLTSLNETLYKAGEDAYLADYVRRRFAPGMRVLDVGCGPGYYARLIASTGAEVIGVDPNPEYIACAQETSPANVKFMVAAVGEPDALADIPSGSIDCIFMSDALLFYFVSPAPTSRADLGSLFAELRRVLRSNGLFISVEPHYIFWLQPWLGDEDRPFTVLSEYRSKTYGVTPTISSFIQALTDHGFAVTWMDEIYATPDAARIEARAHHFAAEFPIGQLLELRPKASA